MYMTKRRIRVKNCAKSPDVPMKGYIVMRIIRSLFMGWGCFKCMMGPLYVLDAIGDQWGLYRMDLEGIEKKMYKNFRLI